MIIPEKAFGLLTEEQQEYLKNFKIEFFNGNDWVTKLSNIYLNDMHTYRIKPIGINNLSELDDYLSPYLSEEFPFIAMDANKEIHLYTSKPIPDVNEWILYGYCKNIGFDTNTFIINKSIDWEETLLSLHPMTEED